MPPTSSAIDLAFPIGGLVRDAALQSQRPFTTADCNNVRGRDPASGRHRGGARPMLERPFGEDTATNPVRLLATVRAATNARRSTETFDVLNIDPPWEQTATSGTISVNVSNGAIRATGASGAFKRYRRTAIADFDDDENFAIEADIGMVALGNGGVGLSWQLKSDADALTTGYETRIEFASDYMSSGDYSIATRFDGSTVSTEASLTDSSPGHGTLRVEVLHDTTTVNIYWRGTLVDTLSLDTTDVGTNAQIGFGIYAATHEVQILEIRLLYTSTESITSERLIKSQAGEFYVEDSAGNLADVSASENTNAADELNAAVHLGKVFIVNTATPLYFDTSDDDTHDWYDQVDTNGDGTLPGGDPDSGASTLTTICQWRGRIVVGDGTNVWYMSRLDDPFDWDFGASPLDPARAIAGTTSEDAKLGEVITCFIPASQDYLIVGCPDSLWMLAGDPASGGRFVNLSQTIGVVGPNAWCMTPGNIVAFLSRYGIYLVSPGGAPVPVSQTPLPRELQNVDPDEYQVLMAYDVYDQGVHLYLTSRTGGTTVQWFIDWQTKAFWPATYDADHQPTALCVYDSMAASGSKVLLGGHDGYVRRHSDNAATDDGTEVSSYVFLGPFRLGSALNTGRLDQLQAVLSNESGAVDWELRTAESAESAMDATAHVSGTWEAGRNALDRPRIRGAFGAIKLSSDEPWSIEELVGVRTVGGKIRQ